jgi:hypothetical protein
MKAPWRVMRRVRFRVVHFNNGMHGWRYTEAEYRQGFTAFLASIRAVDRDASLVWASTTPVKTDDPEGATNDRVNARNAIALSFVQAAGIPLDDQHALMMQHLDDYQDTVHFNDAGARIQGKQAAESIRKLLRRLAAESAGDGRFIRKGSGMRNATTTPRTKNALMKASTLASSSTNCSSCAREC